MPGYGHHRNDNNYAHCDVKLGAERPFIATIIMEGHGGNNNNTYQHTWTYKAHVSTNGRVVRKSQLLPPAHTSFMKPSQLPGEYTAQLPPLQRI